SPGSPWRPRPRPPWPPTARSPAPGGQDASSPHCVRRTITHVMTSAVLVAVIGVIVLLAAGVATVVILLVRRTDRRSTSPVAAPGQPERNAAAGRLVAELDDAVARSGTSLHFARLQLGSSAPDELEEARVEAGTSAA